MPQTPSQVFTYQTRVVLDQPENDSALIAYAALMSQVERCLFAKISAGKKANDLKSEYIKKFQITARQFNSCRIQLEGRMSSIREKQPIEIQESQDRIDNLKKKIQHLEKKKKDNPSIARLVSLKKQRLARLEKNLQKKKDAYKAGKISLCFGSNKLFKAQYHLEENGYASHEEWLKSWQDQRNDSFFLVGSKDEAGGNQSCTATLQEDGSLSLRLRLPHALTSTHGKYIIIKNVRFAYGHETVVNTLKYRGAISYRFKRDEKGWRIFTTVSYLEQKCITRKEYGAIGVDINADHLAIAETDRFGNCIASKSIPLVTYGKSKNQSKASIGDAVAEIVTIAIESKKPIVLEKLDFKKKKAQLKESAIPKHARMLSSFSYNAIITAIKSKGWLSGVKVEEVDPAYTSVIGRVKFARRYGLSIHHSAALVIARRYQEYSERLPRKMDKVPDGKDSSVTLSVPARNPGQSTRSLWQQVKKRLSTALAAQSRKKRAPPSNSAWCGRGQKPTGTWLDELQHVNRQ